MTDIEKLSKEEVISQIRQQEEKIRSMEDERAIVGESLIRANRLAEIIKNKAEEGARETAEKAEADYAERLGGVDKEKAALLKDMARLQKLRRTLINSMVEVANHFQNETAAELEALEVTETHERTVMETNTPFDFANTLTEPVGLEAFAEVPATPPIDLNSLLVSQPAETPAAPAPAEAPAENLITFDVPENVQTIDENEESAPTDLNALLNNLTADQPTVEIEKVEVSEKSAAEVAIPEATENVNDFLSALQNTTPAAVPAPVEKPVDISSLLASASAPVFESVSDESPATPVNLTDLLGDATDSEKPVIQDISDLLKG